MRRDSSTGTDGLVRPGLLIVVVAAAALGFGIAVTSGLWSDPSDRMIAANVPDATHYLWWLGHTPHALGELQNPFRSLDMNWPEGVSAMNNTTLLLPAILLWPISWLADSLVTLNVLNILAVPACALAGYWALRQVPWGLPDRLPTDEPDPDAQDVSPTLKGWEGGLEETDPFGPDRAAEQARRELGRISRPAALVGGVAFGISPAIVNSLVGHITMAFAPGLALLVVLSVKAWHDERPVRNGLLLGALATAQVFTGEEVLFQAVVAAVLILLVAAISRPRAIGIGARRLARTLAVAFAVFLPITAYPLYLQFFGPLKQEGSPFLLDFFGADITAFTTPTGQVLLHTAAQEARSVKFAGGIEEHLAYLGWPLLITCVLTAVICWRRVPVRCAALSLVVAMLLSLGGRLWINGTWTERPGPYRLFQSLPVTEASLATRFGLLAALFAAALLAFAVHEIATRMTKPMLGAGLAAGLSLACLAPLVPVPLSVVDAPEIPRYFTTTARQLPAESVVVVLPFPVATHPVAMRWQSAADYRFRMPGGYFLGPAPDGHAYVGGSADPQTAQLLAQVAETGQPAVVTPQQQAQAVTDLKAWGASRVVLGPDPAQAALRQTMTSLLGKEPQQIDGVDVWTDPVTS
jgi:hypothetical protein